MQVICWLFIVLMCLSGCTKELDLPYPQAEDQIVLNGILHPDSLIKLSVTKTSPVSSFGESYPIVENANVRLYEDDKLLGELDFQDSLYALDYYPKAGHEYSVEVAVPDYPLVRASDVIPAPPTVEICYREDTENRYHFANGNLNINIHDPDQKSNYYWLYLVNTYYRIRECEIIKGTYICNDINPPIITKEKLNYYHSYSSIPDRFNAFVDNTSGGATQYEYYIRVDDIANNSEQIYFDIALPSYDGLISGENENEQFRTESSFYVVSSSQAYDRYLKSSIIYSLNKEYSNDEDMGFKPFVESSQIYSNVKNGTGIFAAYNSVSIPVEEYSCD
jgi:hypothetical protein